MLRQIFGLALATLILWSPLALARGGGYVGFGIGGAVTDGAKYVELEEFYTNCPSVNGLDVCRDRVHTDGAGGLGLQLGFGYNFFGYAALEANIAVQGNPNSGGGKWEGMGHVAGLVKLYPAQFVNLAPSVDIGSRWWDPNVYFGGGYSWMGYHLEYEVEHKARGWEGMSWQFGFGSDFYLTETVALGADFRFILPQFSRYHEDWGDLSTQPKSTPKTLVFAPMLTVTFHFADPLPREGVKPLVK
jgi:hypothetical protein